MVAHVKRIAIFASGRGSNAVRIMQHFQDNDYGKVVLVLSNKSDAEVLQHAESFGIDTLSFSKSDLYDSRRVIDALLTAQVDVIALAGFLWRIPETLIAHFPMSIVNIHPSLLPKYGGEGMYGKHVHTAVKAAGERYTGITIHLVNAAYDQGKKLFQSRVKVEPNDEPETIAERVLELEHRFYPRVLEGFCRM
jgi:phosphoribosylglycinamide formyltransferase-1